MARAFPLQAVLRLRQRREEQEERALAALHMQRQQTETTLGRVQQELRHWTEERLRETGHLGPAAVQQARYARLKALQDARAQLEEQLRVLQDGIRKQQSVYLAARSAREMMSELKQQQRAEAQADEQRREQKTLEDVFGIRKFRR